MIPAIAFHRPATVAEACALSRQYGSDAAFLAGGTELLPDFHRGGETARHLIAIGRITELRGIIRSPDGLSIGPLATLAEIASSSVVHSALPALAEAAGAVGNAQVRSVATLGGNICRAVPCADTPPVLIAAGATVRLLGEEGARVLPLERFLLGARRTAMQRGEMLVEVLLPDPPTHSGVAYQRFARRRGSALAVASVAARVRIVGDRLHDVRLVLGAVAPAPMLVDAATVLLEGESPSAAMIEGAARACAAAALPISDLRASADFRRDLVLVLARRALTEACERAGRSSA